MAECAVIGHADGERRQIRQGLCRAARAALGRRGDDEGAARLREGDGSAVQISAGGGMSGGAATDEDGEVAEVSLRG